jgi:hypothetical protein
VTGLLWCSRPLPGAPCQRWSAAFQRLAEPRKLVISPHRRVQRSVDPSVLTPKRYLRMMLTKMERAHDVENPDEPCTPPSLAEMARLVTEAGCKTPWERTSGGPRRCSK